MRLPGWEGRLTAVIRDWRKREYSWENNCAVFAADAVDAVTGEDVLGNLWIGCAREWAQVLRAEGGLVAAVTSRLGQPIEASKAIVGDIVMREDRGQALGVHIGPVAAFLIDEGLGFLPLSDCSLAWPVGR